MSVADALYRRKGPYNKVRWAVRKSKVKLKTYYGVRTYERDNALMSELTYEDVNGNTVYTSAYLKNRGTCCKTCCLHCPYGHTLKTEGLRFEEVTEDRLEQAQFILDGGKKKEENSVSASFLAGAFGAPKKITPITLENKKYYQFILIKDQVCGLVRKDVVQAKEVFLLEHFKNQGLSLEMVTSFM